MQWVQENQFLGALGDGENLQAKALLQIWLKNNAAVAPQLASLSYGAQAVDHQPAWTKRDGFVLAAFSTWWDASGRSPVLDVGQIDLSSGANLYVDLSTVHKNAVDTWAVEQGFLPPALAPGAGPSGAGYADCVQSCATANAFNPAAMLACMQACGAPAGGAALPFPVPSIPGIPGIPNIAQSNAPAGWPAGFPWPPPVPSWLPAPATPIWPPIGNWNAGGLQKPSWWDATGVPWPPPKPGATPGFPGTWPQNFPFPVPAAQFVQTNTPAPAGQAPCPKGTVWANGACQPLPPAPAPSAGAKPRSSGINVGVVFAVVGALIFAGILAATSSTRVAPEDELEENPGRYVVTLGPEKSLWLRTASLEEARDVAGFTSANHGTIAQVWIEQKNGRRRLYETVRPVGALS